MAVHCYHRPDQNEAQRSFLQFPSSLTALSFSH